MGRLAIIPARGGSKRIPRKNIKNFLGRPIIAYSIDTALRSNLFDEVMVSTDDVEIAEIAKKFGAKVPFFRSIENADDFASTIDVLLEVLTMYKNQGIHYNFGCCIYPTAPFVTVEKLQETYEMLNVKQLDTVFPVLQYSFPIQRALKINQNGFIEMYQPEYMLTRSQDLEKAYHDTGQFYWFNVNAFTQQRKMWTENTGVIVLSEMEAQDIDTIADWEVAEFKYKLLKENI